jgi:uncharacterized coiled-coil protein SlyX
MSTSPTLPPLPELDAIASTVMRIVGLQKGAARHVAEITLEYMAQDRATLASSAAEPAALSSQAPADERDVALSKIADWNSHTTQMSVDYGSNGVRDFYRQIACAALQSRQPAAPVAPVAPVAAVPEGWRLTFESDRAIKVQGPGLGCIVTDIELLERRVPGEVLYALCRALIKASPTPPVQPARDYYSELLIARAAIKELESKVFDQEQALAVLRASVASHQRDMADPPSYLQDAVIKAAGLGAMAEQVAALKKQLQQQNKEI